jgi:hypothetical protein
MDLQEILYLLGLDLSCIGQSATASSCKHGNVFRKKQGISYQPERFLREILDVYDSDAVQFATSLPNYTSSHPGML